jgi:hypothetical protein
VATPTLPDWAIGQKITAELLDQVNAAITYAVDSQPRIAVYDNTGTSCANNTLVAIGFTNEVTGSDTDAMWSSASPTRVLVNTSGWYTFTCFVGFDAGPTFTDLQLNLRLNSAGSSSGGVSLRTHTFGAGVRMGRMTLERSFVAGDYLELFVLQASGGTRTTDTGNNHTGITGHRFGG